MIELTKQDKALISWMEEVVRDPKAVTPKAKMLLISKALELIHKLAEIEPPTKPLYTWEDLAEEHKAYKGDEE